MRIRKGTDGALYRREPETFDVRAIDTEKRTAEFVASTEIQCRSWFGFEVLRAAGVTLSRFEKNPIFLDTHERDSSACVIGRAKVSVDAAARQVVARVEYAKTARAQEVWELVRDGFVRAVSVGYLPMEWKELDDGEVDGEGDARVVGPGVVVTKWELLELSQCPLPADEDALLRRRFYGENPMLIGGKKKDEKGAPESGPVGTPAQAPTPGEGTRAAPAPAPAAPPALPVTVPAIELDAERSARIAEARKREILAITPSNLREMGDALVLEGVDVAVARQRLLEEQARRSKPVGTPEPPAPGAKKKAEDPAPTPDEIAHALRN